MLKIQCINRFGDEDKIIQYITECGGEQHYEAQDLSAKICKRGRKSSSNVGVDVVRYYCELLLLPPPSFRIHLTLSRNMAAN